ncbi:MAG: methylmalonyl Co-A mutase-associated GTPase MeaB [Acidobacteriota bacterium]
MQDARSLAQSILQGDPRALARGISWLEDGHTEAPLLSHELQKAPRRARVIGVTGSPGSGKSTLTDQWARHLLGQGQRVGILAIDPSSPFTGGALLGDRIRMGRTAPHPNVFIRSMATRGMMGGLSRSTHDAIDLMNAAGFDTILVETVGVGQDEVDVVRGVDTCCVVLIPGMGDDIQAIKAGLMEIADVFILNKADQPGIDQVVDALQAMKSLAPAQDPKSWDAPWIKTIAAEGQGLGALEEAVNQHQHWLDQEGHRQKKQAARLRLRLEGLLAELFMKRVSEQTNDQQWQAMIHQIIQGELTLHEAAERLAKP